MTEIDASQLLGALSQWGKSLCEIRFGRCIAETLPITYISKGLVYLCTLLGLASELIVYTVEY